MLNEVLVGAVDTLAAIGIGSALAARLRISPGLGERGLLGLIGVACAGAVTQLFFRFPGGPASVDSSPTISTSK